MNWIPRVLHHSSRPTLGLGRLAIILAWATLVTAASARAQTPTLVKDIDPGAYPTLQSGARLQTVVGGSGSKV